MRKETLPPRWSNNRVLVFQVGWILALCGLTIGFAWDLARSPNYWAQSTTKVDALNVSGIATFDGGADFTLKAKHVAFTHDFFAPVNTEWIASGQGGTAATAIATQSTTARPGIVELQTGTTTTGIARWNAWSAFLTPGSYSSLTFEAVGGWPTLSTVGEEYASDIGFTNLFNSINPTEGCFLAEDRLPAATAPATGTITAGSTNLQCRCCAAGVCTGYTMDGAIVSDESFTTVAAPVAALTLPNTNIYRMRVVLTPGVRAEFYVDSGAGLTKRCDINTHLPTGALAYAFTILKSAGTTSRSIYVDWARVGMDLLAARSL